MLVEILTVEKLANCMETVRVIAIQYAACDTKMESKMREANALFDVPFPDMSDEMKRRIGLEFYRTAILELAE